MYVCSVSAVQCSADLVVDLWFGNGGCSVTVREGM